MGVCAKVPTVTPRDLDRFLARAPTHKVVMLAFSGSEAQASLTLRRAAADHADRIVVGRVTLQPQVRA